MGERPFDTHQMPVDLNEQQRKIADEANRRIKNTWIQEEAERNAAQQKSLGPVGHGTVGISTTTAVAQGAIRGETDHWKHRSTHMQCRTCMWHVLKQGVNPELGRCRRRAPTMNGFPVVFTYDWCGDHKLDENKV